MLGSTEVHQALAIEVSKMLAIAVAMVVLLLTAALYLLAPEVDIAPQKLATVVAQTRAILVVAQLQPTVAIEVETIVLISDPSTEKISLR